MKQKDIAIIIVVAAVSAAVAWFAAGALFTSGDAQKQEVEVVQPISSEFGSVDPRYFNEQSINPTPTVQVGNNNNTDPFKGE